MIKDIIYFCIMASCIIGLGTFGGMIGHELNKDYNMFDRIYSSPEIGIEGLNTTNITNIVNECYDHNTRIDYNLKCVQKHVKRFYHYQVTDDNITLTSEELMNNGGDCANWSALWKVIGDKMKYDTKEITISVSDNSAHRFIIISNHQGYCNIDQTSVNCVMYG